MPEKPTKHYSNKQESAVADYLGWKRVSASGARPFNKGDIISDSWLCECKTHTTKVNTYKVMFSVWRKLVSEATSCMKRPVLIIDNGTQKIEDQCAVVGINFYSANYPALFIYSKSERGHMFRQNVNSFSFTHQLLSIMQKDKFCTHVNAGDIDIILLPIEFFKEMI